MWPVDSVSVQPDSFDALHECHIPVPCLNWPDLSWISGLIQSLQGALKVVDEVGEFTFVPWSRDPSLHFHPKKFGVKLNRLIQIANANTRVTELELHGRRSAGDHI